MPRHLVPLLASFLRSSAMEPLEQIRERFTTTVGETPLEYLNRWRVQRAGDLLRTG